MKGAAAPRPAIDPPQPPPAGDPNCEVHGKPNSRAEKEAATRQREEERQAREQERAGNRERNCQLLDAVLDRIPAVLTRDDYKMLLFAFIERLDYSDWEVLTERHKVDTDEIREPAAAAFELRKKAEDATDSQLVRMLFEIALLPFGYSEKSIEFTSPLASAARLYEAPPAKKARKVKAAGRKAQVSANTGKTRKPTAKKKQHRRKATLTMATDTGGAA